MDELGHVIYPMQFFSRVDSGVRQTKGVELNPNKVFANCICKSN